MYAATLMLRKSRGSFIAISLILFDRKSNIIQILNHRPDTDAYENANEKVTGIAIDILRIVERKYKVNANVSIF